MNLTLIRSKVYTRIAHLRAIDRLINSPEFTSYYDQLKDTTYIDSLISDGNKEAIDQWLKKQRLKDLETMSIGQLRDLARELGVRGFKTRTRNELIEILRYIIYIKN